MKKSVDAATCAMCAAYQVSLDNAYAKRHEADRRADMAEAAQRSAEQMYEHAFKRASRLHELLMTHVERQGAMEARFKFQMELSGLEIQDIAKREKV